VGFVDERPQTYGVSVLNPASIFHLKGDALETHGQHEIDLWFRTPCWEMGHIEAGD
jgi:hypothetical protein